MSKEEMKRETRRAAIGLRQANGNDSDTAPVVEGYALLFDTPSDGLDFEETIARGALDGVIERSDVFAVMEHDRRSGVLARSRKGKGTLSLEIDDKGLRYSFELPDTARAQELAEHLRRGEITESSFCFSVEQDEWTRTLEADGTERMTRRIIKIAELYDVSPVFAAAYSATSVDMRGAERLRKEEAERAREFARMDASEALTHI